MDGEMPDVFNAERPKANKEHICLECGKTIKKGERYVRSQGHWPDLGWATFKTCEDCEELRAELHDPDFGSPPFGYLAEWAQEAEVEFPRQ